MTSHKTPKPEERESHRCGCLLKTIMNFLVINSPNSVSTSTKRKREAERSLNWTVEETQVLLCAWSDERVQKSLAENLRNRHVFKHLSVRMSDMGFSRSPHQCRLRVKTLKANYVRAKLLRSVDSSQTGGFRYYAEMDAVLGRKALAGGGGSCLDSVAGTGGRHLGFFGEREGIQVDSVQGGLDGGVGARPLRQLVAEIKVEEDREVSTDGFEFHNAGFTSTMARTQGSVSLQESFLHSRVFSAPTEDDLSSEPPSETPNLPPPPPLHHPASPLPEPTPGPSAGPAPTDSRLPLEPALKHLSDCFQSLVSESRGLLERLEVQRREQGRWQQELLAQWLEREDRRQREAADREERRERARMEHEIRVLQLLTGLARQRSQPRCRCGRADTGEEALACRRLAAENGDGSDTGDL
ncbi:uncharacterized protein LOC124464847 [Hypomesus transpacificus]|uniref:uncharacterized protein LOC124464847 n=1 Tax=Hypomesus transpacificus TaxID=137520 RepID=UPI001F07B748|nr:uncharacterized protein LOC124464847 [Hypomesus transpacificus]